MKDRDRTHLSVHEPDVKGGAGALNFGQGLGYFIITFGCQQNDHDSERIAGLLEQLGYRPVAEAKVADLVVLNTCSIRENADGRFYGNLGLVKAMRDARPGMLVAVCGCMMRVDEHVARLRRSYPFVDLVFGPADIHRLPELLLRRLEEGRRVYDVTTEDGIVEDMPVVHGRRFRALVTIMYGCNNFCAYCIVPYTRGRERSRRLEAILDEVRQRRDEGFAEVMLLGQNVNSWQPEEGDADFASLLEQVAETGIPRLRFMTSHPKDISPRVLEVMAAHPNIERHLHLPLQSGSDEILRRMNRRYDSARFMGIVEDARCLIPDIGISTDIIVGFPGETEADFQATLDVVERVGFDAAYMFQYSPRYGTPAAMLEEQIDAETMRLRFDRLLTLMNRLTEASNRRLLGRQEEVLIESADPELLELSGRTSSHHLVRFALDPGLLTDTALAALTADARAEALEGYLAQVEITETGRHAIRGVARSLISGSETRRRP